MYVCNTMEQFTLTIHIPVSAVSVATLHNDASVLAATLRRQAFQLYRLY